MLGFVAKVAAASARCNFFSRYATGPERAKVRRTLYVRALTGMRGAVGQVGFLAMVVESKLRSRLCAVQCFAILKSLRACCAHVLGNFTLQILVRRAIRTPRRCAHLRAPLWSKSALSPLRGATFVHRMRARARVGMMRPCMPPTARF